MLSPASKTPNTLADARRVAIVTVLAYIAAIVVVAAGLPALLPAKVVAEVADISAGAPP